MKPKRNREETFINYFIHFTQVVILMVEKLLLIKVGDEIVYSFIAKPGGDYLKDQSNIAIKNVYLHFQKLRQNNNNKIKLY